MHRGEIWYVNLDPTVGSETNKKRPCIILTNDAIGKLPNKVIVPLTEWDEKNARADWLVKVEPDMLNQLEKASAADAFLIRSVSRIRLVNRIGILSKDKLDQIIQAVLTVINDI